MKTPKLTQVYVSDGAALYVNGNLAEKWFTMGHCDLLQALGFKTWDSIRADEDFYKTNEWPKELSDVRKHTP